MGTAPPEVEAKGSVRITFNTLPPAPLSTYTPNNVVALWIQDAAGQHVRTVGLWSAVRTQHLVAYRFVAGVNDTLTPDAVSGASRLNHQDTLVALWNLKDKLGQIVPDGTYTIRIEFAEGNTGPGNPDQNRSATFTFLKGPNPQTQTPTAIGFANVSIDYDPERVACGDGVADEPETCDYAQSGSCIVNQSGCPGVADKCMPQVFQGDPMQCTATCVLQPITSCIPDDMCCPPGCDEASDSDCRLDGGNRGGGGGGDDVAGGCAVGAEGGLAVFALFGLLLVARRRVS